MESYENDRWLSLSEASDILGVHTSTLRRWADDGRVACRRTPGGHRRFSLRQLQPLLQESNEATLETVDEAVERAEDQPWHDVFVEAGVVDELRTHGQRLSGVLMQFLLRDDADARHLKEGRDLGREYAAHSQEAGISLMDAVRAFLFFRTSFTDILGQMPAQAAKSSLNLYNRYDRFMSEVLLGLIAGYHEN